MADQTVTAPSPDPHHPTLTLTLTLSLAQVTDHGKEFLLIAFVCLLVQLRSGRTRQGHKCVRSTSNVCAHSRPRPRASPSPLPAPSPQIRVEKFNGEVNVRVLAPLRLLLNSLERNYLLDKDNHLHIGAFSSIARCLMQAGLDRLCAAQPGIAECPTTGIC